MKILSYAGLIIAAILIFLSPAISQASDNQVRLYLFWQDGCPHCAAEKEWLTELRQQEPYASVLAVSSYDATTAEGMKVLRNLSDKLNFTVSSVPVTVIGDRYFVGFDNRGNMAETLRLAIDEALVVGNFIDPLDYSAVSDTPTERADNPAIVSVPFWGMVNPQALSLPALAVVIGLLDGFNPCAMWSLLFLISVLLGMQNRKRMWLLGSAFIFGSAAVYFVFMAAWLNLLLFLGFIAIIRIIIGLTAIGAGAWSLRKFWRDRDGGCAVTGTTERRQVFEKIKQLIYKKSLWLSLIGILVLSFAVNLVELLCSAGFPAIFTQVLALNNLTPWQYYGYILLYLLFFIIDDLVVFVIAMVTLRSVGLTTKYSRWSNLIGGILMVIIGLLLIFKYQWLMFG